MEICLQSLFTSVFVIDRRELAIFSLLRILPGRSSNEKQFSLCKQTSELPHLELRNFLFFLLTLSHITKTPICLKVFRYLREKNQPRWWLKILNHNWLDAEEQSKVGERRPASSFPYLSMLSDILPRTLSLKRGLRQIVFPFQKNCCSFHLKLVS